MIDVMKIDYSKPEAEVRKVVQARVMGVVAGIKAMDTLKSDTIRATAMLIGGLSQLDKNEEVEALAALTQITKTADDCYRNQTELPALADNVDTALVQTKSQPFASRFELVADKLELTTEQRLSPAANDLRLACANLTMLFVGLFLLVDEIYRFDLLDLAEIEKSRAAVVAEPALDRLLNAGLRTLHTMGTPVENEACE